AAAAGDIVPDQSRRTPPDSQEQRTVVRRPVPAGDVAAQMGDPLYGTARCGHRPDIRTAEVPAKSEPGSIGREPRIEVDVPRLDRVFHRLPLPAVQSQDRQWRGFTAAGGPEPGHDAAAIGQPVVA